jgi:hypothetical protein
MNKALKIAGILLVVAATLGIVAYAYAASRSETKMLGVVVAARNAALEVKDQPGATDSLVIDRVLAPGDSWVVVHLDMDGKPGDRVGFAHVNGGETTNVIVKLDPKVKLTEKLLVALHADRGIAGKLEFDMKKFESSPDKPYFVNGMELAKAVVVRAFGVKANVGEAAIEVADQPGVTDALVVARAVAPTGTWIVVHLDDNGKPGARVGYQQIPAGESLETTVSLKAGMSLTDKLLVAIHADRGVAGTLEFDMMDKINSPDQPFFVNGKEVATAVRVR